jgi:uncharacterized protein YcfL
MKTSLLISIARIRDVARLGLVVILTCFFLVGCTSIQQISTADLGKVTTLVQPGDKVVCSMRDGSIAAFKVASIEGDVLVGESGRRVLVQDMTGVEIKRMDTTKSVLLGLAIAGGVAAAVAIGGHGGGGGGGGGNGY